MCGIFLLLNNENYDELFIIEQFMKGGDRGPEYSSFDLLNNTKNNYIGFQERNTLAKILDNFLNKKISKHILKKKIDAIYDRVEKKLQFFEHGPGLNLKRLRHSDIEISLSDDFSEDIIDELYEFVKTKEDEITQVLVFFNEKKLFNEVKSITKDLDVYLD